MVGCFSFCLLHCVFIWMMVVFVCLCSECVCVCYVCVDRYWIDGFSNCLISVGLSFLDYVNYCHQTGWFLCSIVYLFYFSTFRIFLSFLLFVSINRNNHFSVSSYNKWNFSQFNFATPNCLFDFISQLNTFFFLFRSFFSEQETSSTEFMEKNMKINFHTKILKK